MNRVQAVERDEAMMGTIVELTGAFEGVASMRIAQIKNQVLQAQSFFNELWEIYQQLRVDRLFRFGRSQKQSSEINPKELFIVITAEGGFSGDIDEKLINWMLSNYDKSKQDLIMIGHHGAVQLAQQNISFRKYFRLPERDQNINVTPIIKEVQQYSATTVYYQTYVSLMIQDIKRIEMSNAVQELGKNVKNTDEFISPHNYIFEPSTYAVIDHLERSMLNIALSQVILDSKLAQYASRFRAMSGAHTKAEDSKHDLHLEYNRAKRAQTDERLKEILNGLRITGGMVI